MSRTSIFWLAGSLAKKQLFRVNAIRDAAVYVSAPGIFNKR
jgi:hypothetical protein